MKKTFRILFTLTSSFDPNAGGVQRTTYKLGKHFSENGHEVSYFSTQNQGHTMVSYGTLFHAQENGSSSNPNNMDSLVEVLKSFQPNFVINQMPYDNGLRETLYEYKVKLNYFFLGCLRNSLFNFRDNVEYAMTWKLSAFQYMLLNNPMGISAIKLIHWFKHRRDLRNIINEHDRFILLSPPNRKELEFFVGAYKRDKVIAIPNSIPDVFENSLADKEKIILHVGRIEITQKRSDLIIPFWERAHKLLPKDWKFVLVGYGGYYKELESEIKKKNLPRIELHGFKEPEQYYRQAQIFMMPSAFEGFPNTLLEAQSYGCIPFAFNSYEALSWIVNDNKDAFLITPYDTDQMAMQVAQLAKEPLRIAKMQKDVLKNAKRFTIDKVGDIWFELFESLEYKN